MYVLRNQLYMTLVLVLSSILAGLTPAEAYNPIIQTVYTADPAPIVYNDRVYLFTSHDQDTATDWYDMIDWQLFSSADMVNWQHHATPMSLSTFSWATEDAWAGQVVERNGRFYYYVPINTSPSWDTFAIGVGISDTIEGPYVDAIGAPLITAGQIDPTVYIDDDGQAYLYMGNPNLWYITLNEDMISYSGGLNEVNLTASGFGDRGDGTTNYQEGPWFYKQNGLSYMVYAADCCPENVQYATSTSPTGPWNYGGVAMATGGSSDTNHPGVIEFQGNNYFFYHDDALPGGSSYHRSVCVESFEYNSDGSIPLISMSSKGPTQLVALDPFIAQEAETIAFSEGLQTQTDDDGTVYISYINNGDYSMVAGVDFGNGATAFTASVASATDGGDIELYVGNITGSPIGVCSVNGTGGWTTWTLVTCSVSGVTGTNDLYFSFTGTTSDYLFNIDWWQFSE
ncbi:hypothetical protein G7054_g3051 [Neopestalotiopsis clavispora]|nr:hypothetical protein G7054_g3051 [Neopestalotiopsis clavispora]